MNRLINIMKPSYSSDNISINKIKTLKSTAKEINDELTNIYEQETKSNSPDLIILLDCFIKKYFVPVQGLTYKSCKDEIIIPIKKFHQGLYNTEDIQIIIFNRHNIIPLISNTEKVKKYEKIYETLGIGMFNPYIYSTIHHSKNLEEIRETLTPFIMLRLIMNYYFIKNDNQVDILYQNSINCAIKGFNKESYDIIINFVNSVIANMPDKTKSFVIETRRVIDETLWPGLYKN